MFNNDWDTILKSEIEKLYFKNLLEKLDVMYKEKTIYPEYKNIFRALEKTSYKNTKVVILGQDPYHGKGEADGLAFSVPNHIKTPPSLRNIKKEMSLTDEIRENNELSDLAEQGVLLLNTILTVEENKPLSHKELGWEMFTDEIIKLINKKEKVIFVLLGKESQKKKKLIAPNHVVLETSHPSPLSVYRGFSGSRIFDIINNNLDKKINWIGDNIGKSS